MSRLPSNPIPFTGLPMARAPQWLKPYLDAVDGAVHTGGIVDRHGKQTHAQVELFRGGEPVGSVTIELPRQ